MVANRSNYEIENAAGCPHYVSTFALTNAFSSFLMFNLRCLRKQFSRAAICFKEPLNANLFVLNLLQR